MRTLKFLFRLLFMNGWVLIAQAQAAVDIKQSRPQLFKQLFFEPQTATFITLTEQKIRRLADNDFTVLPPQTRLQRGEEKKIHRAGQHYILSLWHAEAETLDVDVPGGGADILAVFVPTQSLPVDKLNVKLDRTTGLAQTTLQLGQNEAFVVNNSHHNAGQAYLISTLFQLYQGKLQAIDSIFTLSAQGMCDSFRETLTWYAHKHAPARFPSFTAQVQLLWQSEHGDSEDCRAGKVLKNRVFSKTYHWNRSKHRYEGQDQQFQDLQRFNAQNV